MCIVHTQNPLNILRIKMRTYADTFLIRPLAKIYCTNRCFWNKLKLMFTGKGLGSVPSWTDNLVMKTIHLITSKVN